MRSAEHIEVSHRAIVWRLLITVLAPFIIMSVYLLCSRWPSRWFTESSDYAGMAGAVVAFIVCLGTFPARASIRVAAVLITVPVLYCILTVYSLWFVGVVFNDWL